MTDRDGPNHANALVRLFPWIVLVFALVWLIWQARPARPDGPLNLREFAKLPVSYQGRVKPVDSVARNCLLILSHKQSLKHDAKRMSAVQWFMDVIARPQVAEQYEMFRIDHPEVLAILGRQQAEQKYYSAKLIREHREKLLEQIHLADQVPRTQRNHYQRKVLELGEHVQVYEGLAQLRTLHLVPPLDRHHDWMTAPRAMEHGESTGHDPPGYQAWRDMLVAYRNADASRFNATLSDYQETLAQLQPGACTKAALETFLNEYAPFYRGTILYVLIGLLVCFSWLGWRRTLMSTANKLLVLTLILHTLGLMSRIYLSGRPPVTNLYGTAIFIGWGAVLLCVLLERVFRNTIGTAIASVTGFVTLIMAHHLADGDTMAVLQAVLDTNLWLATHVVVITIGYASTYLAGLLGIAYILRGILTRSLTRDESKKIGQMVYGILCFALLFSFVGTILGGLWADQSWGRFWGWDPKENGAVLIVLWNAMILHTRWAGMSRERGMAIMAVGGNIVTSWSYFGTNMLGVGLHSYGFIDSAVLWLWIFIFVQLLFMNLGLHPINTWASQPRLAATASLPSPWTTARLFAHGVFSGLMFVLIVACLWKALPATILGRAGLAATVIAGTMLCGYTGFRTWRQFGHFSNLAGVPVGAAAYFFLVAVVLNRLMAPLANG